MKLFRSSLRCLVLIAVGLGSRPGAMAARPPEWLQPLLQAKPDAGSHQAVRLLDAGDVRYISEDSVRRTYRGAVRVLSEHGRARAVVRYSFNPDMEKLISAQAWVVAPDGRKADTFSTPSFSDVPLPVGRHIWNQRRLLSYSGAGKIVPGGVLAWEVQIESKTGISDVNWDFDSDLPVQKTWFELAPPPGGRIEWYSTGSRVPKPVAGRTPGSLRWELDATVPPRGDRPEGFLAEPQALFARAVLSQGKGRTGSWADFARLAGEVIMPRIVESAAVKSRAEAIVAGKPARWEKIRALSEWVQREITYLSVTLDKDYLAGYRPHPADQVLGNRYGDCKDKMTLLIAMLRAVGENGVPVLVAAGNPVLVRPDWPAALFNHVIVGIPADDSVPESWPVVNAGDLGRLVLFDPTDPVTPLGFLPASDQAGRGLVVSPLTRDLIDLPVAGAATNRYRCVIQAALDEQGTLVVSADEKVRGGPGIAIHARQEQQNADQTKRGLEARLREGALSVQDLQWSNAWNPASAEAGLTLAFKAERYARRTGTLTMLSPQILFARARLAPWQTNQPGVAWIHAASVEKEVRLTLPAGSVIEELPDDLVVQESKVTGRIAYQREADVVLYRYEMKLEGGLLDRATYDDVRSSLLKMHEAERRPIVLRRPVPASSGSR